jgi:hypothetical protein
VDDLQRSPFRLRYLNHALTPTATTYTFDVELVPSTTTEFDGDETAQCDHMTLDYAQIQLCK